MCFLFSFLLGQSHSACVALGKPLSGHILDLNVHSERISICSGHWTQVSFREPSLWGPSPTESVCLMAELLSEAALCSASCSDHAPLLNSVLEEQVGTPVMCPDPQALSSRPQENSGWYTDSGGRGAGIKIVQVLISYSHFF